jgi:hypothetical protein
MLVRYARGRALLIHRADGSGASLGSGSFQGRDALFDRCGLGLNVLEIGRAILRFGPEFAQVGFQLGDALGPAGEPPLEAWCGFDVVTVSTVVFVMLTVSTRTATTALRLAASTMAAACCLLALAATATSAGCFLAVAVSTMPMAAASAATSVPAMTFALSAHCLHSPVLIRNCCSYSVKNRSNCARVPRMLAAQACRNSIP